MSSVKWRSFCLGLNLLSSHLISSAITCRPWGHPTTVRTIAFDFSPVFCITLNSRGLLSTEIGQNGIGSRARISNYINTLCLVTALKQKCEFNEIIVTGYRGSCHFDHCWWCQWWQFHRNDIFVSMRLVLLISFRITSPARIICGDVTHEHMETQRCVLNTVATDALVLQHQGISMHSADQNS